MKKNLFFVLAVAGALASCSNDETLEVTQQQQSKTIGFNSYVDKATRADVDLTELTKSGNGFNVWGQVKKDASQSTVFTKELVTWETGDPGKWNYTSTRYWQTNSEYAFTAIGPKNAAGVTYNESTGTEFLTNLHGSIVMNIQASQADVDVVYDYNTRTTTSLSDAAEYAEVPFTFNHILSKVRVVFENGFTTSGQNLKITGVKIISKKKGTLTLTGLSTPYAKGNGTWTDSGEGNYTKECDDITGYGATLNANSCIEITNKGTVEPVYLIPNQDEIYIEFSVQLYSGDTPGTTYEHTDTHKATATITGGLVPGTSYVLTATITPSNIDPSGSELEPIKFTVTGVTDWGTDSDVDVNL